VSQGVDRLERAAAGSARLHERPRWARASSGRRGRRDDRLIKIEIRVGRTGALNPWAMLSRSRSAGVTSSRATLHNEEEHQPQGDPRGRHVIVQRAGDVIPQIVGPAGAHRAGTKPFRMPSAARSATPSREAEGEAMHRCPNRACPSRGLESLINWVQAAADIDGVGEQLVRRCGSSASCARSRTSTA
jgi:DNA ligase (NAD+)